jgi:hypothetical protein
VLPGGFNDNGKVNNQDITAIRNELSIAGSTGLGFHYGHPTSRST